MYKILKLNQISTKGLGKFAPDRYEITSEANQPDAILVRSQPLTPEYIYPPLKAIARAGVGVNNIPVEACTERGIPVFNTPGANANAVKELVLAALIFSSRRCLDGILYVNGLDHVTDAEEMKKLVETNKNNFQGRELAGKTLGVVGLGAIGSLVSDMGLKLGMDVVGFDPELSVDAAWRLSNKTQKMENLRSLLSKSDYVTLHLPVLEATRDTINSETVKFFKLGAHLLNFSRGEIVNSSAVISALESGQLAQYVTDFPTPDLIGRKNTILLPHIGSCTTEAEDTCAVMAVDQLISFLEHGNIKNSVNFPTSSLERTSEYRIALSNKNVPGMLGGILSILADRNINISEMLNKSRHEIAYNLIDIESPPTPDFLSALKNIEGVINVRSI
ncbi:MAG: phosphoglycerate dehydrogenase [Candidatus Scalinduaceae bacterium]